MKFTVIMNKEPKDKLDLFTKKMVKEVPAEKPSIDFSKNVMDAIYAVEAERELKKNQPLISKRVWALFIGVIVAASVYLFATVGIENSLLSSLNLRQYTPTISYEIPTMSVSNVTIYGFVFLAVMISIQIGYIKNYYTK